MAASPSDEQALVATAVAPAGAERPLPGLRAWFALFLLWMGGLAALALSLLERVDHGSPTAQAWWLLSLMCFYLSLCNIALPLPTAWIILYAASDAGGFDPPWLRVLTVAGLGALATAMANLNEYHLLAWMFQHGWGRRIRATRIYGWGIRWFNKAPFQILALVGFVPLPIDAVRWLAILRHYSRLGFGLAYFVGRGLRYVLFATFSVLVPLTAWQIAAVQAGILLAAVLTRLIWRVFRRPTVVPSA